MTIERVREVVRAHLFCYRRRLKRKFVDHYRSDRVTARAANRICDRTCPVEDMTIKYVWEVVGAYLTNN